MNERDLGGYHLVTAPQADGMTGPQTRGQPITKSTQCLPLDLALWHYTVSCPYTYIHTLLSAMCND